MENTQPDDSLMTFTSNDGKEIIKISRGKFFFNGEEVTDKYKVYERFNEWLTKAERKY